MIIPKNGGHTCTSRSGKLKKKFDTDKDAIEHAKYWNDINNYEDRKLVAYKCPKCFYYHVFSKLNNVVRLAS